MLRNSTNIPSGLVIAALKHAMPPDTTVPLVVEVRNKMEGKKNGQWGWYYPSEKRVVVIVPRELKDYHSKLKYCKQPITFRSRAEFLVAIMAHEVRHHYQYEKWTDPNGKWRLRPDRLGRLAREIDAETWELKRLEAWRLIFSD